MFNTPQYLNMPVIEIIKCFCRVTRERFTTDADEPSIKVFTPSAIHLVSEIF